VPSAGWGLRASVSEAVVFGDRRSLVPPCYSDLRLLPTAATRGNISPSANPTLNHCPDVFGNSAWGRVGFTPKAGSVVPSVSRRVFPRGAGIGWHSHCRWLFRDGSSQQTVDGPTPITVVGQTAFDRDQSPLSSPKEYGCSRAYSYFRAIVGTQRLIMDATYSSEEIRA